MNDVKKGKEGGYTQKEVTIKELYESGRTHEPSEKALRDRAKGILVFIESSSNIYYYDEILSIIRVNAARKSKRPGIAWSTLGRAMNSIESLNKTLVERLKRGESEQDIVNDLSKLLLQKVPR